MALLLTLTIQPRSSITRYMPWLSYGLLAAILFRSRGKIYARHIESPGTRAYAVSEARLICAACATVCRDGLLSFGGLLDGGVDQRDQGLMLSLAKAWWSKRGV